MDELFDQLRNAMEPGQLLDVKVGLHWTMVTAQVQGRVRAGLATTMPSVGHHHRDWPDVRHPGQLESLDARELASWVASSSPVERSIGLATINALLPRTRSRWEDVNAEEVIAAAGKRGTVVMIGHFPFAQRLRSRVQELWVLELEPRGEDIPAAQVPEFVPRADVLAITSVTLLNHTLSHLLALRRPDTLTILMGPSTPVSPILFRWGVDILSGAIVTDIQSVQAKLCQGAGFRQLHRAGIRLITLQNSPPGR